jgi:ABC-type oligopeptide transport system substrate-binding subunit
MWRVLARRLALLLTALAVLLAVPASSLAGGSTTQATMLVGKVGQNNSFNITLTKAGKTFKTLKPGVYKIVIHDYSAIHNFHLKGPKVNKTTSIAAVGTKTWTVTLRKGTYTVVCDPHATVMKFAFRVT